MPFDPSRLKTLFVVIMENRSFDHVLGCRRLKAFGGDTRIEGLRGDAAWKTSVANPYQGESYAPFRYQHDSIAADPPHERADIATQLGTAKTGAFPLKGFVKSYAAAKDEPTIDPGHKPGVMGYYTPGELPITHFFADNYAICDHWFAPLPASTQPNRLMAMAGFSLLDANSSLFLPEQELVYDWLTARGVRWRVYHEGIPFFLLMPKWVKSIALDREHFRSFDRLVVDVQEEKDDEFPQVVFIEPKYTDAPPAGHGRDDHPPASVRAGQAFLWETYVALTSSPERWASSALAVFYDEHGGFFDHVQPLPIATKAPNKEYDDFTTTGLRVPGLVVSPFVSAKSVFNGPLDHTSVLKFLGEQFGKNGSYSPQVDARAGVGSLRQVFDLGVARADVPAPPTPSGADATIPASKQANGFEAAAKAAYEKFPVAAKAVLPDTWHV